MHHFTEEHHYIVIMMLSENQLVTEELMASVFAGNTVELCKDFPLLVGKGKALKA